MAFPNLTGTISDNTFYKSGIEEITDLGTVTKIVDSQNGGYGVYGTFQGSAALRYVALPQTLEYLGASAFSGCTSLALAEINLPALTTIGGSAFYNCTSLALAEINLPALTTIGGSAFRLCKAIVNLRVNAEQLSSMPTLVFADCTGMKTLYLNTPALTTAGGTAWNTSVVYNCTELLNFAITAETPPTWNNGANMFMYCDKLVGIYVPDSAVETYKAASGWTKFADKIKPLSEWPGDE